MIVFCHLLFSILYRTRTPIGANDNINKFNAIFHHVEVMLNINKNGDRAKIQ